MPDDLHLSIAVNQRLAMRKRKFMSQAGRHVRLCRNGSHHSHMTRVQLETGASSGVLKLQCIAIATFSSFSVFNL